MNPITFNDFYKAMSDTQSWRECQKYLQWPRIEQVCASPLFVHNSDDVDYGKLAEVGKGELLSMIFAEDNTLLMHFPMLRACLESPSSKSKWHVVMFSAMGSTDGTTVISGRPVRVTYVIWNFETMGGKKAPANMSRFAMIHSLRRDHSQGLDVCASVTFLDIDRNFALNHGVSDTMKEEFVRNHHAIIMGFLYDVLSPANHVAKVTPDKSGKSVQWKAAREHYVILDRRHEANNNSLSEGQAIPASKEKNLERISHSRRAHWRTFRHARYSEAVRAKRKWIASIWVGPKIWRDLTGSIYQIIR